MVNGPRQTGSGEWCVVVEAEYAERFAQELQAFTGGGQTVRRDGTTFFFPEGMKAPEVVTFWNEWVAQLPAPEPSRTGRNPVRHDEYIAVHGDAPGGVRRWRFVATHSVAGKSHRYEGDGEYAHILPGIQEMAQEEVGDCELVTQAACGEPSEAGTILGGFPHDWVPGEVRNFWLER